MTEPRTPRTEAGRRLLDIIAPGRTDGWRAEDILAIEAEAAAAPPEPRTPRTCGHSDRLRHNDGSACESPTCFRDHVDAIAALNREYWGGAYERGLGASPVPEPPLDVERLAEALHGVTARRGYIDLGGLDLAFGAGEPFRALAVDIIEELARLAGPPSGGTDRE